nr:hypothetical protein [Streptomyces prasinopilosus]
MTERKPPDVSFGTWGDRRIREAGAREDCARLPGAGKPPPRDREAPYDGTGWTGRKPAREGRRGAAVGAGPAPGGRGRAGAALAAPSERTVRKILTEVGARTRAVMLEPPPGPPPGGKPYGVEDVVRRWRERRAADGPGPGGA